MEKVELLILGGGPAGLAAGIYGARSGLKTIILEEKMAGGTTADAPSIQNYLGFQSIKGMELAQKMVAHCKSASVDLHEFEGASSLDLKSQRKTVKTSRADYDADAVIIATGTHYRAIGVPGESEFRGRGVSYCGLCDGPLFKGKRVLVAGGGNSAVMTALFLSGLAAEVKIAHRRDAFRAEEALVKDLKGKGNVEILWNIQVMEIKGDRTVNKIALLDVKSGEMNEYPIDGVFVQVGEDPNSQLAREAGVAVDESNYILVDCLQRTNIPGVYSAGDVTNHPVKQIGTAVGQGITASLQAYAYIRRPYYKQ